MAVVRVQIYFHMNPEQIASTVLKLLLLNWKISVFPNDLFIQWILFVDAIKTWKFYQTSTSEKFKKVLELAYS